MARVHLFRLPDILSIREQLVLGCLRHQMVLMHATEALIQQCAFANWMFGLDSCCRFPASSACNQASSVDRLDDLYDNWALDCSGWSGWPRPEELEREHMFNRPVELAIDWGNGTGHAIVVIGCVTCWRFPVDPWPEPYIVPHECTFLVHDPWYGDGWVEYFELINHYQGSGRCFCFWVF